MTTALVKSPTAVLRSDKAAMILGDAQGDLATLAERLEGFLARVDGITVTNDAEMERLNDLLGEAKVAFNKLEADRVERKKPILEEGRVLDSLYRPAAELFERLEKVIKREKLLPYLQAKQEREALQAAEAERLRLKAEEDRAQALLAASQAQTEADRTAAEARIAASSTALIEAHRAVPLNKHTDQIRSDFAHTRVRYKTVVRLVDIKLVPRDLLEEVVLFDWKKREEDDRPPLLASFAKKLGAVPGLSIEEEQDLTTRAGLQ